MQSLRREFLYYDNKTRGKLVSEVKKELSNKIQLLECQLIMGGNKTFVSYWKVQLKNLNIELKKWDGLV